MRAAAYCELLSSTQAAKYSVLRLGPELPSTRSPNKETQLHRRVGRAQSRDAICPSCHWAGYHAVKPHEQLTSSSSPSGRLQRLVLDADDLANPCGFLLIFKSANLLPTIPPLFLCSLKGLLSKLFHGLLLLILLCSVIMRQQFLPSRRSPCKKVTHLLKRSRVWECIAQRRFGSLDVFRRCLLTVGAV